MKSNKQLILDLDSTLIYFNPMESEEEINEYHNLQENENVRKFIFVDSDNRLPPGTCNKLHCVVVIRPHMKKFIKWSSEYFEKVHVWTAGHLRYGMSIMNIIFQILMEEDNDETKDVNDYISSYYSRDDCTFTMYNKEEIVTKSIKEKGFPIKYTLCLDDNPDTFSKNPGNGVLIPRYDPDFRNMKDVLDDKALLQFMDFCNQDKVRNGKDVTRLNKKNIFY